MSQLGFRGWKVPPGERGRLLETFPPAYPQVVADHVTFEGEQPPAARRCRVVGVADDGAGVQALVVEIDGTTERPDGSRYHITWSLDRSAGRTAVESNDVIRSQGWRGVTPVEVALEPRGAEP